MTMALFKKKCWEQQRWWWWWGWGRQDTLFCLNPHLNTKNIALCLHWQPVSGKQQKAHQLKLGFQQAGYIYSNDSYRWYNKALFYLCTWSTILFWSESQIWPPWSPIPSNHQRSGILNNRTYKFSWPVPCYVCLVFRFLSLFVLVPLHELYAPYLAIREVAKSCITCRV